MNVPLLNQNQGTQPENVIKLQADVQVVATSTGMSNMFHEALVTTFDTMSRQNCMPKRLAPYMSKMEYARKMEEINKIIQKHGEAYGKKQSCWKCLVHVPCVNFCILCCTSKSVKKIQAALDKEANEALEDWRRKGLDCQFKVGQTPMKHTPVGDIPNSIDIFLPEEEEATTTEL